MAGRRDLKDDEILRFLRFSVKESSPGTYTEQSFDTQLSIDRGLIWLIHFIQFAAISASGIDPPAAGTEEHVACQILRESKTGIIGYDDSDIIEQVTFEKDRSPAIGTDAGPIQTFSGEPVMFKYNPPLVFAAQNIYIGVFSTNAAEKTMRGRVGFTLRRVSDKFFYRVAQALIS